VLGLCVVGVAAAPAVLAAGAPAWRLSGVMLPSNLVPGQNAQVQLQVENVGDASSNGSAVTVVDRLPRGVVAIAAGALAKQEPGLEIPGGPWSECEGAGTSEVACTYAAGAIEPVSYFSRGPFFEEEEGLVNSGLPRAIGIEVHVEPTASGSEANVASVSGGGALDAATATMPTVVGSTPAPFDLAGLHQWATDADGTPDTQAGSHPYQLTTSFSVNTINAEGKKSGQIKDFHLQLPAGLVGDPLATPRCPREVFDEHLAIVKFGGAPPCPSDTQVGIAFIQLEPNFIAEAAVYNLVPPVGIPAQFGLSWKNATAFIDASVRTGEGYNAVVDTRDLNQQPPGELYAASVTLWGDPADPSHDKERFSPGRSTNSGTFGESISFGAPARPFLTLPTSCGQRLELTASVDSWEHPVEPGLREPMEFYSTDMQEDPVTLSGCDRLGFSPSLSVTPQSSAAETPTGLEVDLKIPQNEDTEGLAESDLKDATVQLPAGMTVNPSAATGRSTCPLEGAEGVNLKSSEPARCPNGSKLGTVDVVTPLLEHPLEGSVFLAQQGNLPGAGSNPFGSLFAIYVVAEGDGVAAKIPGHIEVNEATGQLTARFGEDPTTGEKALPQLPYSELKMNFFNGPRAPLITPASCSTFSSISSLTPWSGGAPVEQSSPFSISSGCANGFVPSFVAGLTSNQAGGSGAFVTTVSRKDGEQRFGKVEVVEPEGLLGAIKSVVRCPEPQASEGTCSPESLIGEATAATGAGEQPYWVTGGKVYLTGPYKGAPFGLSIVVPTTAGPFTLRGNGGVGHEVVRATINVNPHTTQVTVSSDALPTMLEGVPLDVKTIYVSVNRAGFIVNPTNCSPSSVTGTLTSTSSTTVQVSSPFSVANCATLPFDPSLSAFTQAKTSKADGAGLQIDVGYTAGQANLGKLKTDLPLQLPSRLTTLQKSCAQAVFEANPASCPSYAFVGTVSAATPLLASPLTGPAVLVNHGGAKLPNLAFVLQGEGITVVVEGETHVVKGITSEAFKMLPDAPISHFQASFPEGPYSLLAANGSLCANASKLKMPVAFTGQNGAIVKRTVDIAVTGCAKSRAKKANATHRSQ
jgi:hypothetical protein